MMKFKAWLLVLVVVLLLFPTSIVASGATHQDEQKSITLARLESHFPFIITEEEDFPTYGFEGEGTSDNPYIIENLNISGYASCIEIEDISSYFVIRNCWLQANDYYTALSLNHIEHAVVSNCWIQGGDRGIIIEISRNVRISDCTIVSASEGIRSSSCNEVIYSNNTIVDNEYGMVLENTRNSTVSENRIYANSREGLRFGYGSSNNSIMNNILGWNERVITLLGEVNAIDNGISNTWSGNHLSDYDGFGVYSIQGDGNATDYDAVQLVDEEAPLLESGESITIDNTLPSLNISIDEDYPLIYELLIDGNGFDLGYYFNGRVVISLAALDIGANNITMNLLDGEGNEASFTIHIEIVQGVDPLTVVYVSIGIVVIVSIIVVMEILRRRK